MNTKDNILIANSIKKELTDNTFNLELAKQGYPVCTKSGHDIRIICFDRNFEKYPIVALYKTITDEQILIYTISGNYIDNQISMYDLVMKISK